MDALQAAKDTISEIAKSPEREQEAARNEDASMAHLYGMLDRMRGMSESKVNRWLGYIQGVAVANNWLTLEQCKEINKRNSGEEHDR